MRKKPTVALIYDFNGTTLLPIYKSMIFYLQ